MTNTASPALQIMVQDSRGAWNQIVDTFQSGTKAVKGAMQSISNLGVNYKPLNSAVSTDMRTVGSLADKFKQEAWEATAKSEKQWAKGMGDLGRQTEYVKEFMKGNTSAMELAYAGFIKQVGGIEKLGESLNGLSKNRGAEGLLDQFAMLTKTGASAVPQIRAAMEESFRLLNPSNMIALAKQMGVPITKNMIAGLKAKQPEMVAEIGAMLASAIPANIPATAAGRLADQINSAVNTAVSNASAKVSGMVATYLAPVGSVLAFIPKQVAGFVSGLLGIGKAKPTVGEAGSHTAASKGPDMSWMAKTMSGLSNLFKAIGPVALFLEAFQPVIDTLKNELMPLFNPIVNMALNLVTALSPLVNTLLPIFQECIQAWAPILLGIVTPLVKGLLPVLHLLEPVLLFLVKAMGWVLWPVQKLAEGIQWLGEYIEKHFGWLFGSQKKAAAVPPTSSAPHPAGQVLMPTFRPVGPTAPQQAGQASRPTSGPSVSPIVQAAQPSAPVSQTVSPVNPTAQPTTQAPAGGGLVDTLLKYSPAGLMLTAIKEYSHILQSIFGGDDTEKLIKDADRNAVLIANAVRDGRLDPELLREILPGVELRARGGEVLV